MPTRLTPPLTLRAPAVPVRTAARAAVFAEPDFANGALHDSRDGMIGAGEGNRTLVFSLEGCRKQNNFNDYSDKTAQMRLLTPKGFSNLSERILLQRLVDAFLNPEESRVADRPQPRFDCR